MRAAGVTETVQVVADAPVPIATPVVGMNFKQPEIESAGDAAHAAGHRAALAGGDRKLAERESDRHQRRVRVRQRLPGQRRRRQRQRAGAAAEPVHRGRHRGNTGAHVGHLGGIRPLQRRRDQRHHQERRQHVFGQRAGQLPESVVDDRDAVRSVEAGSRSSTPTICSRSTRGRSAARSSGIACGSSRRAVTRRSRRPGRCR